METATQALHRLTSYKPGREWTAPVDDPRIVQGLQVNDPARFPWQYKRYPPGLTAVQLPRDLPTTAPAALDVLAGTAQVPKQELSLPHLARLLYLSAGVVRTTELSHGRYLFRAAGSAGGRFPLEVYVAVPEGGPLPAGLHWYDPAHARSCPDRACAGRDDARSARHRRPVAHRLAVPRARLPADALLFTCVGVPAYPSVRAGSPGAPNVVRMVQQRD